MSETLVKENRGRGFVKYLVGALLGFLLCYFTMSNNQSPVGTGTPVGANVDTTFIMRSMSSEAITMEYEVTCKVSDIDEIKVILHEKSLNNTTLFFYNGITKGDINNLVPLPYGAKIKSMSFEQTFMDLVTKSQAETQPTPNTEIKPVTTPTDSVPNVQTR